MPEVHSSHIKELSHEGETLKVTFRNGRVYHFDGVKAKLYQTFLASPSKGKFFARWIAPHKKGKEITDDART